MNCRTGANSTRRSERELKLLMGVSGLWVYYKSRFTYIYFFPSSRKYSVYQVLMNSSK